MTCLRRHLYLWRFVPRQLARNCLESLKSNAYTTSKLPWSRHGAVEGGRIGFFEHLRPGCGVQAAAQRPICRIPERNQIKGVFIHGCQGGSFLHCSDETVAGTLRGRSRPASVLAGSIHSGAAMALGVSCKTAPAPIRRTHSSSPRRRQGAPIPCCGGLWQACLWLWPSRRLRRGWQQARGSMDS